MKTFIRKIREALHDRMHRRENAWIDHLYSINAEQWRDALGNSVFEIPGQPTKEGDITHMSPLDEQ